MPSQAEIEDLLSKTSEYTEQYQATFAGAKNSLDKAPIKGFNEKAVELAGQANTMIAAIRKNGRSAYALVALIAVLDDMSLNAARATAMATLVAVQAGSSDQNSHAMLDVQDLAQAEKNCYDISELLLHSTLRLIGFEEAVLHKLVDDQSPQPRKQQ